MTQYTIIDYDISIAIGLVYRNALLSYAYYYW